MTIVQQIHNKVDTAQERLLEEATNMIRKYNKEIFELQQIKTDVITNQHEKGNILIQIGFTNTPEAIQRKKEIIDAEQQRIQVDRKMQDLIKKSNQANDKHHYLSVLINRYPFQKILTVEELDRICNKYDLVYSNASNYIKSIPDKNIQEIANAKKLESDDVIRLQYGLKTTPEKKLTEIEQQCYDWYANCIVDYEKDINWIKREIVYWNTHYYNPYRDKVNRCVCDTYQVITIDKRGLFIAAPKSHFRFTTEVKKGFGFFKSKPIPEPKDPIVFEFMRYGFVRILSKWGDEAEDPALIVPVLN